MVRLVHHDRFKTMLAAVALVWLPAAGLAHAGTREYAGPAETGVVVVDGHPDIQPCSIEGWSTSGIAEGLKVRRGPDAEAVVVGHLPPPVDVEGYSIKTQVSITGSKNGWFRIGRGDVVDYIGDAPTETVFEGEGWVPGRSLGLAVNHANLHAKPSSKAPIVARLGGTKDGMAYGADSFQVERLLQCVGDWVEVEGSFMDFDHRGWTSGTCANQVTTCP